MSKRPEVIIIRESIMESWLSDASTVATFVALIGIGVYLESNAMQWVGAVVGFISIFSRAANSGRKMTTSDARKRLDEIEASLARSQSATEEGEAR